VAGAGSFAFLEVNDGSCFANMQVMVDKEVGDEVGGLKEITPTATCVLIEGELAKTPEGTKQKVCGIVVGVTLSRSESGAHSRCIPIRF
jgi:asparaginyl-tRNA synthetase